MEVDTQKDIQFYSQLVKTLGQEKADKVAPAIFTEDLNWMSWEACRDKTPKAFFYKILNINGEVRLVNQRDLSNSEDILKKIHKEIRGGLEYSQMVNVRSRLLSAENGAVLSWISPKKMFDGDMNYPLDQINIAKKIDQETVWVKQLQGDFAKLKPDQSLENLMLTIEDVHLQGETEFNLSPHLRGEDSKGQDYVNAIKQGLFADQLRTKRAELLRNTMEYKYLSGPILTSCGFLDFGMSKKGSGGIIVEIKGKHWCSGCQVENTCTANCFKCGGPLSSKPVSYT